MFSILFVVGAVYAGLTASKTVTQAVASAIPLGLWKKNMEHVQNMKLGINTEYNAFQEEKRANRKKKSKKPEFDSNAFSISRFPKGSLPPSMQDIERRTWILTMEEGQLLLSIIASRMALSGEGEFSRRLQGIAKQSGMSYDFLLGSTQELMPDLDIEKLMWLSDNRLSNPLISAPLLSTMRQNQNENG